MCIIIIAKAQIDVKLLCEQESYLCTKCNENVNKNKGYQYGIVVNKEK